MGYTESDKTALKAARYRVGEEYTKAKAERKNARDNLKIDHWKGNRFDDFKKDRSKLDDLYSDWNSKFGWGDDGSINGVMDKLDHEVATIGSYLDSIFN